MSELAASYEGADLPVPENWGGFRLVPRGWSSGSTGRTASMTGSATREVATAVGNSNGLRRNPRASCVD